MLKIREDELTLELAFDWLNRYIELIEDIKECNNALIVDECRWCDINTDIIRNSIYMTVEAFVQLAKVFSLDLDTCLSKREHSDDYPYELSLSYNMYRVYAIASESEINTLREKWK